MSHGLLFWRSFTHWVGGMGVLVFITMLSGSTDRSMNILKAEMPGPVKGKLTPRTRDTARVLYLLYFLITAVLVGMLLLGGMPLFDSLVHAFGTVGTGGFGIRADSIASYSPYIQGVITVFMILCGINFNLYYLLLLRQWRAALRSDELWTYLDWQSWPPALSPWTCGGCTAVWAPACGRRRSRSAPSSPPPAMPRRTLTCGRDCPGPSCSPCCSLAAAPGPLPAA